jgi:hypothetical protein
MDRRAVLAALAALPVPVLVPRSLAAWPLTAFEHEVALGGRDPVSYFDPEGPVAGDPGIALLWRRATWRFANRESRARFEAHPTAFAPAYGGYCALAMASGRRVPGMPEAWALHAGRLYLCRDRMALSRWQTNPAPLVTEADAHWAKMLDGGL